MKVKLGEINTTPNDFDGNRDSILTVLEEAKKENADLTVFPELAICGYLSKDLLYQKGFIQRNLEALRHIQNWSAENHGMAIVVGYASWNNGGKGKPFANMAAVVRDGMIIGTYQKHLLPFYDVFDEGRYFEPGTNLCVVNIAGKKCGITICEDVWNDKGADDYSYEDNPVGRYRKVGVEVLINISSSPFAQRKSRKRFGVLSKIPTLEPITALIYVNQLGGQDELVFDGKSCIITRNSSFVTEAPGRKVGGGIESQKIAPARALENISGWPLNDFDRPYEDIYKAIILGLSDYVKKSGFKKVVLGSSGGVDSALVAALAAHAVGPKNVHCIMMPGPHSSEGSVKDAQKLHRNLGCVEHTVPIRAEEELGHINQQIKLKSPYDPIADENIQARLRGLTVMHFSNAYGALPLSTGNKTELAVGYCTLYGDMNGGFNPIGDLYKLQVYQVADFINEYYNAGKYTPVIPKEILQKAPSAELAPDQTDEKSLLPYEILDFIAMAYLEYYIDDFQEFFNWVVFGTLQEKYPVLASWENPFVKVRLWVDEKGSEEEFYKIIRRIDAVEFKRRQAAPCIKLSKVSFGTGRRLPIVQKLRDIPHA